MRAGGEDSAQPPAPRPAAAATAGPPRGAAWGTRGVVAVVPPPSAWTSPGAAFLNASGRPLPVLLFCLALFFASALVPPSSAWPSPLGSRRRPRASSALPPPPLHFLLPAPSCFPFVIASSAASGCPLTRSRAALAPPRGVFLVFNSGAMQYLAPVQMAEREHRSSLSLKGGGALLHAPPARGRRHDSRQVFAGWRRIKI